MAKPIADSFRSLCVWSGSALSHAVNRAFEPINHRETGEKMKTNKPIRLVSSAVITGVVAGALCREGQANSGGSAFAEYIVSPGLETGADREVLVGLHLKKGASRRIASPAPWGTKSSISTTGAVSEVGSQRDLKSLKCVIEKEDESESRIELSRRNISHR